MKIDQEYRIVGTTQIKPHPQNARRSAQLEIEESINSNGWYGVIVVQKSTMVILAGHHKWNAAKAHKAKKVPVVLVDVDDATALRILLADNRIPDLGDYDEESLLATLGGLESLEGTGYLEDFQEELEQQEAEAEGATKEEAKAPKEPTYALTMAHIISIGQSQVADKTDAELWLNANGMVIK